MVRYDSIYGPLTKRENVALPFDHQNHPPKNILSTWINIWATKYIKKSAGYLKMSMSVN